MLNEEWKDIKGYEGIYKVSNYGKIKNIRLYKHYYHTQNNKIYKDYRLIDKYKSFRQNKILINSSNDKGYFIISLCKNNISKTNRIHQLVAQHFIPNPDNKPCVNHKDGNKQNNNVSNLEWCTHKENMIHAYEIGLKKAANKKVKILKGDFSKTFNSLKDCSIYLNVTNVSISQAIIKNLKCGIKKYKCKGYIITYV
jgi:hypothetical protein